MNAECAQMIALSARLTLLTLTGFVLEGDLVPVISGKGPKTDMVPHLEYCR